VAILLASLQSALIWFFVVAHDNNGATPKIEFWLDDLQKGLQKKNRASVCFPIPVISPISFAISIHYIFQLHSAGLILTPSIKISR
jgi:hypothetical protein